MTVFIYEKKKKVELTLRETAGLANWNLPMNSNDFRVFKDVQNTIEFIVRNTDRKPINMMGREATITMYDQRNSQMLWTSSLKVMNEAKGICQLVITPDVMSDWYLAHYSYSVTVKNMDGSVHMLYVDQNETQRGFFELCQGPSFDPLRSLEILGENLHPVQQGADDELHYLFSSALPGTLQRNNFTGLHTAAIFFDNYSGEMLVQGSVEQGTPSEGDWYDIETRTYDHKTGPDSLNIEANLFWVRFRFLNRYNEVDGYPVLDANRGKVAKLVFRN